MSTRDVLITAYFFIVIAGVLFVCALSVGTSPQLFFAASAFFWIATMHLIRVNIRLRHRKKAQEPPA